MQTHVDQRRDSPNAYEDRAPRSRAGRALGALFAIAMGLAPAGVHAQTQPFAPADVAERDSIATELDGAVGLYVTSGLLVTGGGIALLLGLSALTTELCPPAMHCTEEDLALAGFVAGTVAVPLGAILLAIAIGLHVDGVSRREALRRRLSVSGGPGQVGLSLRFDLLGG